MKYAVGLAIVLVSALAIVSAADLQCSILPSITEEVDNTLKAFTKMEDNCITKMKSQIQMEIDASYQYLRFAAHFSRDTVNRPGFASLFFNAAKEERDHGIHLIEYLSMRGHLNSDIRSLFNPSGRSNLINTQNMSGAQALAKALELETQVTNSIRGVISACEKEDFNDYHLVDYLTGVYLEEQYKGQRDIAGKMTTLLKMEKTHKEGLAEFLFDKEL